MNFQTGGQKRVFVLQITAMMQKKRATDVLREKLGRTITFWGEKINKNFFYKKWAIFVAA